MVVKFTFQSVFGNSLQNPRHFSARGREESLALYSILWSDWPTSKQKVLRHGNRFVARVRRRYFSEGEKRRPEMRLRFAGYLNCSLSFTPLNLFQQIDFSMWRRIPSEHTQSKWKCTSSFFGLPSRSLLSYTPSEFFRKALQCLPLSLLSLRAHFLVHIFLKVYSCRATFQAIPVPLNPAFSVWGLVEPLYWF